jgi:hypothetical protein
MRHLLRTLFIAAAAQLASAACAHTVDKGLATISVEETSVNYHLQLAVSAANVQGQSGIDLGKPDAPPNYAPLLQAVTEKLSIAANGKACTPGAPALTPPPHEGALVTIDLRFACAETPRTLDIRDNLFDVMGGQYHTISNVQWTGGSRQFVFMAQARELHVDVAEASAPRSTGSFFPLGIEHILTGYDHLLFLLALILRGGNIWSLLKIITAFTIAHSITLALAALNIVVLPERLVEATIALSIAYVAAENIFMRKAVSHRWAVSFLFGLVHGFGFSNVLRELGLPTQGLVWALLNFNLGVETGQAIAVLLAVPLLFWIRRFKWEPRAVMAASALVLAVGLILFVDRALLGG